MPNENSTEKTHDKPPSIVVPTQSTVFRPIAPTPVVASKTTKHVGRKVTPLVHTLLKQKISLAEAFDKADEITNPKKK